MKFELETYHRDLADEDLIDDVRNVAARTGRDTVTIAEYESFGRFHPSTLQRRFKSWFNVLKKAGLQESRSRLNIPDEELFENVRNVWMVLKRQPKYDEMRKPLSRYSASTYEKRFGSWRKGLEAFVEYVNTDAVNEEASGFGESGKAIREEPSKSANRRTSREPSERLRFSVLLRDGFRCQTCGKSPLSSPGVELQVDHIVPWSRGGETVRENLQSKCLECNLGKGNAFEK